VIGTPLNVSRRRRQRVAAFALTLAGLGALLWLLGLWGLLPGSGGVPRAAGEPGEPSVQTDASVPAREVEMLGATPAESGGGSDETWGLGAGPHGPVLVRYTREANGGEGGWVLGPGLQDETGAPLSEFQLDTPQAFNAGGAPSPLAGQLTPDGAGAMLGRVHGSTEALLVREPNNPANPFREVKPVPEADLAAGESLFSQGRAPLLAPLDENSHPGAFVVPVLEHAAEGEHWVLHWDGETQEWKREPIELPSGSVASEFHVLGIGATSPTNAWLAAQTAEGKVALFQRHTAEGEAPSWRAVALKQGGEAGEPLQVEKEDVVIPGQSAESVQTQVLTVTEHGIWIDGEGALAKSSTTVFYRTAAEGGPSTTAWCSTAAACRPLRAQLPAGPSRSIAWSGAAPFGERIIAGLKEGISLRLEGEEFVQVLGLGGKQGSSYGAAFTNPDEGWLGSERLPLHITSAPAPDRLTPWPTAFRRSLLAIAPQPGAPVGALSSAAVAVGDLGEVTRYQPGVGWVPETLFGPSGKPQHPRLRAVAWPTPSRVYAVGDGERGSELAMWLWRGETGLWEPDPAEPPNFRGNLLGIAFDPTNPARGYAVGETGVLLHYGKSWTQDAYPAEPPCSPRSTNNAEEARRCSTWSDASFTSVAFAGSEAIVAYRVLPQHTQNSYLGGLIVNEGSGWHIDHEATSLIAGGVPWAVAGLPDGGAAFSASGTIYEREDGGAHWQATATPFPGGGEPGTLELFREGGALRAIAAGSAPQTYPAESEPEAAPGSPPTLPGEYPLSSNDERALMRQTATGWSDEEHELNAAREPEGTTPGGSTTFTNYKSYDTVYEPDAVAAVLVDGAGSQGWAVGGTVEPEEHGGVLDTTEVARYRESSQPPGVRQYALQDQPQTATLAFGGGAQCAAPCAARARARVGPDVWLANALAQSAKAGAAAFLYAGPRLPDTSANAYEGKKNAADRLEYPAELGRYAGILASSPVPTYTAPTPFELDESGSEAEFDSAFSGLAAPLGGSGGAQEHFYAVEPAGGEVRVMVLDDSSEAMLSEEVPWLDVQLETAANEGKPALVVGSANLNAEIEERNHPAAEQIAAALAGLGNSHADAASAYFFDAPEENVRGTLEVGGGAAVPTFGSGTLGYVSFVREQNSAFNGASGFLRATVALAPAKAHNQFEVNVTLIPDVEELALEAQDGTLLHRSQAALFAALARRPRSGNRSSKGQVRPDTDPYIKIPANCVGAACASAITPEYEFISSRKDIGDFVTPNLAVNDPRAVLLGPGEVPIPDSKSGLFCAYNKGVTEVTIRAGGFEYTLPVTVQAGSVRRPCGTTHLNEAPVSASAPVPAPPPATQPAPNGSPPASLIPLPLPPPALVTVAAPVLRPPAPQLPPFIPLQGSVAPIFAAVPPPLPTPARPTPPSGTSPVTQPVEAAEKEEEQEEATESVSNQAVAYRSSEHEQPTPYILGVIVLAAFAGSASRRPRRRRRREVQIAPATVSSMRAQRRAARRGRWM